MSRTELLEQLAEKATRWRRTRVGPNTQFWDSVTDDMIAAIDALDALPATPGEMVEFSAWEHEDGMIAWYRAGSRHDLIEMSGWTRLGTVRLPLVKETRDAG